MEKICKNCEWFDGRFCTAYIELDDFEVSPDKLACDRFLPRAPSGKTYCPLGHLVDEDAKVCPHCGAIRIAKDQWIMLPTTR